MSLGKFAFGMMGALFAFGMSVPDAADASSITERPIATRSVSVGGAVIFSPKYEGSDEFDVTGIPLIFPQFGEGSLANRLTIYGADDVRFRLFNFGGFEFGPLAGYKFEREEDDGDLLGGLSDIDGGLLIGAYAGYRLDALLLDVAYATKVTGDDEGYLIRVGLSAELPVTDRFKLIGRVGANYADDNYMQTNFGITAAQATTSTALLGVYTPEAGFKDAYVQLGARIELTDRITLMPRLRYSRLLGDAADSPVVETEDQLSGSLGVTYRFDW